MAEKNVRQAEISRKTNETDIKMKLVIDGTGEADIDTGIGFFDHMLNSFTRHGLFDMKLSVKGDLYVDTHHSIEDTGIVLGGVVIIILSTPATLAGMIFIRTDDGYAALPPGTYTPTFSSGVTF